MTKQETKAVVKALGGPYALAAAINAIALTSKDRITPQAISLWSSVPARRCQQIEAVSNGEWSCHRLRPDFFPAPQPAGEDAA